MGMKPFWVDYTNHMFRFYCRNEESIRGFRSGVDEENFIACRAAMKELPEREREVIRQIYRYPGCLTQAVDTYVEGHPGEKQTHIFDVLYRAGKRAARLRGLIA